MKKRAIIAVIVVVVIAALGAGGWWAWTEYEDQLTTDDGPVGGSGMVEADQIAISSVVAGRITGVLAEEGAEVSSGTPMFTIDSEILDLQVDQASAGVSAAKAILDQVNADEGTPEEVAQAQAQVDQAEAALAMARLQASYANVESPAEGVVTQVTASEGENAAPGKTLAIVSDLERLYVSIYVPETRIGELSLGDRASVVADSSDRTFDAEVAFIASEAEFTPASIETKEQRVKLVFEVRLEVDNIGTELKPGMPVDVEF